MSSPCRSVLQNKLYRSKDNDRCLTQQTYIACPVEPASRLDRTLISRLDDHCMRNQTPHHEFQPPLKEDCSKKPSPLFSYVPLVNAWIIHLIAANIVNANNQYVFFHQTFGEKVNIPRECIVPHLAATTW